jgi:acyl-CoA reductase-like NAD-dependent aldehyde dehydrogenase
MNYNFQVISPIDQSVYCERRFAFADEIEATLKKAKEAQSRWENTSLSDRISLCKKALDYFIDHAIDIGEEITWQMGRPIRYTPNEILKGFKERSEYMMGVAPHALADQIIEDSPSTLRCIKKVPLGTVMVLAPWNYPYLTSVNVIFPALMAGNTVILKHAQQTPLCAERYAAAFEYAGLPDGVFQYLHISHKQVEDVIQDERIDFVAFTGSVSGGHAVQSALSGKFINTGMELGGKDAAYVRVDADLDNAVENLVDGSFFNSGQSCCGIERIYVHESLFDSFVAGFVKLTNTYQLDHPMLEDTTLGPVVRIESVGSIQSHIDEALDKGAKALINQSSFGRHGQGAYMAPQVLINVNHSMRIMTEETFGPVVGIMPVKDDQEALDLINDSTYGLTASIWSTDEKRSMEMAQQINTGTVFMNRCDYLDPALAWTGVKNSGKGCTLSAMGYDALTRPKSFHFKK